MSLRFSNVTARHGRFGPERASLELHPQDEVVICFALEGLAAEPDAEVRAFLEFEVRDASSNVLLTRTDAIHHRLGLGGDCVTGSVQVGMSEETAPGEYEVLIRVTDQSTGERAECEKTLHLLKPEWTIVKPRFFLDRARTIPAGTRLLAGETLYFSLGFAGVDRTSSRIEATLEVQVLEGSDGEQVAPAVSHMLESEDPEVAATAMTLDFEGELPLNRPGRFVVRFVAHDRVTSREARFEVPISVELA